MKMTWTQPICDTCWVKREPDRNPVRVKEPEGPIEMCAFCGMPTGTGIYVRHDPRTLALTVGHLRRALEEFGWNLPDDAQVIIELNEGEGPMGEFEHPARLVQRLELDGKPVLYVTDSSLSSSAQAISPVRWDDDYHSDDVIPDQKADSDAMLAAAQAGYRFEEPETSSHNQRVLAALAAADKENRHEH